MEDVSEYLHKSGKNYQATVSEESPLFWISIFPKRAASRVHLLLFTEDQLKQSD